MAIELRHRHDGGPDITMTVCPLCGHKFTPTEKRSLHFANHHGPEDVGL